MKRFFSMILICMALTMQTFAACPFPDGAPTEDQMRCRDNPPDSGGGPIYPPDINCATHPAWCK